MTKEQIQDTLVGRAIGDALGYPVEFVYSFEEFKAKYSEDSKLT